MRTVPLHIHQGVVCSMQAIHRLTEDQLSDSSAFHFKKQMQYLNEKHELGSVLPLSLIGNILLCSALAVYCATQLTSPGFVKYFMAGCFIFMAILAASQFPRLFKKD